MSDVGKRAGAFSATSRRKKQRLNDEEAAERNRLTRALTAVVVVLGVVTARALTAVLVVLEVLTAGVAHIYTSEIRKPIHEPPRLEWETHCKDLHECVCFSRYHTVAEKREEREGPVSKRQIQRRHKE